MYGVKYGGMHSYEDWGLYQTARPIISPPEAKVKYIDVPGMDGVIDATETLTGEVVFEERKFQAKYIYVEDRSKWSDICSAIMNHIQGKRIDLILDEDKEYYYSGRMHMKSWSTDQSTLSITIEGNVRPYKYKLKKTTVTAVIDGEAIVNCPNGRMSVVPELTVSGEVLLTFGEVKGLAINDGTYVYPDIKFVEGTNQVICSGSGTITFVYQEGSL